MSERNEPRDLKWAPKVGAAGFYRVEHSLTVSPAPGAHMLIDLELPDGPSRLTIIIEKEGDGR